MFPLFCCRRPFIRKVPFSSPPTFVTSEPLVIRASKFPPAPSRQASTSPPSTLCRDVQALLRHSLGTFLYLSSRLIPIAPLLCAFHCHALYVIYTMPLDTISRKSMAIGTLFWPSAVWSVRSDGREGDFLTRLTTVLISLSRRWLPRRLAHSPGS